MKVLSGQALSVIATPGGTVPRTGTLSRAVRVGPTERVVIHFQCQGDPHTPSRFRVVTGETKSTVVFSQAQAGPGNRHIPAQLRVGEPRGAGPCCGDGETYLTPYFSDVISIVSSDGILLISDCRLSVSVESESLSLDLIFGKVELCSSRVTVTISRDFTLRDYRRITGPLSTRGSLDSQLTAREAFLRRYPEAQRDDLSSDS